MWTQWRMRVGTSLSSRDANSYLTNWRRKPAVLKAIFGWWFGFDVFCLSRFFITMRRTAVVTIIINRQWCDKDFDHVQSNYSTWAKTAPKQISLHFINRFKNNVFHRKRCSLRSFCMEHDVIWFSSWWKKCQNQFLIWLTLTHLGFRHIITHWHFRHHPFAHGHKLSLGREAESLHIMTEISSSWNRVPHGARCRSSLVKLVYFTRSIVWSTLVYSHYRPSTLDLYL